jgi:acyl-coenzyme A synthetase/AMP-(fatty) acid ligase
MANAYLYLSKHASETPNKTAVVFGKVSLTFSELQKITSSIGTAMKFAGLEPGQTALIAGGNQLRNYILAISAMHQGAVAAIQIGPKYNPAYDADIAFSIVPIPGFSANKTTIADRKWEADARAKNMPGDAALISEENPIVRLFQTSGTTGQPKVLEYRIDDFPTGAQPNRMTLLPFGIFNGGHTAMQRFKNGATHFLATGDPRIDLDIMRDFGVKELMASPAMIADICDLEPSLQQFAGIEKIYTVGSKFPQRLFQLISEKHPITFVNRFGATESVTTAENVMTSEEDPSYVGTLFDDVEVRVVDENFLDLPFGEVGRIGVRSPRTLKGYKNNPEANRKHFIDGFFFSGDEGFVTKDRKMYLLGRTDEHINAGGRKLDPTIVDNDLLSFKGVVDAAVFGFEKNSGIRGLAAAMVLRQGVDMGALLRQIPPVLGSKTPDVFIQVKLIPRNAMGKAQRLDLEKQLGEKAKQLAPKFRMNHEE